MILYKNVFFFFDINFFLNLTFFLYKFKYEIFTKWNNLMKNIKNQLDFNFFGLQLLGQLRGLDAQ